jgi:predicted secreted protein
MKTTIHAAEFPTELEYIQSAISRGISGKLDTYIAKYTHEGDVQSLDATFVRMKNETFGGKIVLYIGQRTWRTEREDFKNLDDLISHLFTHLKEQMMK